MSLPWFRMYTEFATDPDIQCLAFEDQRHYVVLLCLKGSGVLDKDYPDPARRYAIIRKTLGLDSTAVDEAKRRLMDAMLIDELWQPLAWDKRQFDSDHSGAERTRRWRQKRDVTVTDQIQIQKQKKKDPPLPPGLDVPTWDRWDQYRKAIRKPIKSASVQAAQRKLAGFGEHQGAVVEQSIANGWTGLFALKDANANTKPSSKQSTRFAESTDKLRAWADG